MPSRSRSRKVAGKKWVSSVVRSLKRPGAFSRKARSAGMSTQAYACKVLRSPSAHSLQTRRQAQFFVNISKKRSCRR